MVDAGRLCTIDCVRVDGSAARRRSETEFVLRAPLTLAFPAGSLRHAGPSSIISDELHGRFEQLLAESRKPQ